MRITPVVTQRVPTVGTPKAPPFPKWLPGPNEIQFEWPQPGQVRMRRLVHRGAPRPVSKLASLKLKRTVQCESRLEVEVALLLDACPGVTRYAEQPANLYFFAETGPRLHVPDFLVAAGTYREFIEVKFEADLNYEVRSRTARLTTLLKPYGWRYRLVTETSVRAGYALENAQLLLRRGRQRPPEHWSLATFERIRTSEVITLAAFGWDDPGSPETAWLCHEILAGTIQVDRTRKLGPESQLYVERTDLQGGLPWLA